MDLYLTILLGALAITGVILIKRWRRSEATASLLPLPPGPPPLPFIGNVLDVPTFEPWKVYDGLSQTYGAGLRIFPCRENQDSIFHARRYHAFARCWTVNHHSLILGCDLRLAR